jgi:hypothetical protein
MLVTSPISAGLDLVASSLHSVPCFLTPPLLLINIRRYKQSLRQHILVKLQISAVLDLLSLSYQCSLSHHNVSCFLSSPLLLINIRRYNQNFSQHNASHVAVLEPVTSSLYSVFYFLKSLLIFEHQISLLLFFFVS